MTSVRYKCVKAALKLSGYKNNMLKDIERNNNRDQTPAGKDKTRWTRNEFEGRAVWSCQPETPSGVVYIHQHGGGFVYGLQSLMFSALREVCDLSGATVIMPDYPLPPASHAPDIIDWAVRHYRDIRLSYPDSRLILGGDSAGANLSLAMMQEIDAAEYPSELILWSAWLDLTHDHPVTPEQDTGLIITAKALEPAVAFYTGGQIDRRDPRISPALMDVTDLPPCWLVSGGKDILHPSIVRFAERLKAAGKLAGWHDRPDYAHYWMFYPVPDRHVTLNWIADILRA